MKELTVGKLIERLSNYDKDTIVVIRGDDHSFRGAYVTDALAEREGFYLGESYPGVDGNFTVVVVE